MKRDYEKLCNLLLIPYDQAVERDLIEDMPDNDLHNLISFLIDDALNYSNDNVSYGTRAYIRRFESVTDEQLNRFCMEFSEYEYWAKLMLSYLEFNKNWRVEKISCKNAANNILSIFDYYHTKTVPKLWLDNKPSMCYKNNTKQPTIPNELNIGKAQQYFSRAYNMKLLNNNYKWNASHAKLGFFCMKAYSQPRPITELESFFGVKNLAASITQASYEPKRNDVIFWRKAMDDKIFFD